MKTNTSESWGSRIGVIAAVAGSAVGLGNFLQFPGMAAQFGGGAFMIAYFISLIILGIPVAWMEWAYGRFGSKRGFHSPVGILQSFWKHPAAKYVGVACVTTLLCMYTYYSYVEAWCLGYAINFITGKMHFTTIEESGNFWSHFVGLKEDGGGVAWSLGKIGPFILIIFLLNMYLIYRGISRGIEKFAKMAVPSLTIIAIIVLIRVLTLSAPDANHPEQTVSNGLGFMWNPTKVYLETHVNNTWQRTTELIGSETIINNQALVAAHPELYRLHQVTLIEQLKRPRLWLAAASQIFFSLSIGFGAIMVYASYTKRNDDIALSSLTAVSANEFTEVCLGGLISIPAAYIFLGATGVVGQGFFQLGFTILPMVFANMHLGWLFGFLFFFLLFLASVSGVLCQLQSGIAFLEEAMDIGRKRAVTLVALITNFGAGTVIWFSQDIKAMDTMNFWVLFLIFVISMINVVLFGWVFGLKRFYEEIHEGAAIRIPKFFGPIIRYICPCFLMIIFSLYILLDVIGLGKDGIDEHILDLIGSNNHPVSIVAWIVIANILLVGTFLSIFTSRVKKYKPS